MSLKTCLLFLRAALSLRKDLASPHHLSFLAEMTYSSLCLLWIKENKENSYRIIFRLDQLSDPVH